MKRLVLATALISISIASKAQFNIGLKGGLAFNQMQALGWQKDFVTSPFGGIYANFGRRKWSLQIEGLYTTESITQDTSFKGLYKQYYNTLLDSTKSAKFSFNKIQVPVMITLKFNKKLWVQGGLQYNNSIAIIDKNNIKKTTQEIFKTNDVAIVGGLWMFVNKRFGVHARYTQSLKDLNNLGQGNTTDPNKWKSQSIQLGIHLRVL